MQQGQDEPSPLFQLGAAVSKLLGRALGACLATGAPPSNHTVSVQLQQCPESPWLLGLRVCDDGLPLPADDTPLERCCSANLPGLAPLLASPLFLNGSLLAQTTGLDEVVVRRYTLQAAPGCTLTVAPAGAEGKPPGSSLRGSVIEATVLLQPSQQDVAGAAGWDGMEQQHPLHAGVPSALLEDLPSSAEEVASSLQQLLGMLRTLAPPVQIDMRLDGVLLQAPDGSLQPVSGSRRMDLPLDDVLTALERLHQGMAAEFLPPPPAHAAPAVPEGGGPATDLDDSAPTSASEQTVPSQDPPGQADGKPTQADVRKDAAMAGSAAASAAGAAGSAGAAATAAGGSAAAAGTADLGRPQPLTYIGVGEAGWGCPGAAQQVRGCKWRACAGLVLQLPDHAGLRAGQRAQQAQQQPAAASLPAAADDPAVGTQQQQQQQQLQQLLPVEAPAGNGNGGSSGGSEGGTASNQAGTSRLPVFLFRSWALQLEGQAQAAKGLEKVDWSNYGFQLLGRPAHARSPSDGALTVTLQCAQPLSGARLVAGLVHLIPCEYRAAAERGKPPALSQGYEARLVRAALEGALQELKSQCPSVVSSRRELSLGRALPPLSKALAGILLQSREAALPSSVDEDGDVLQPACAMVGCLPAELETSLGRLLRQVVTGAADAAAGGEGGSRRQRADAGQTAELPPEQL